MIRKCFCEHLCNFQIGLEMFTIFPHCFIQTIKVRMISNNQWNSNHLTYTTLHNISSLVLYPIYIYIGLSVWLSVWVGVWVWSYIYIYIYNIHICYICCIYIYYVYIYIYIYIYYTYNDNYIMVLATSTPSMG